MCLSQVKLVSAHRQSAVGAALLHQMLRSPMTPAQLAHMEQQRAEFMDFDPRTTLVAACDKERVFQMNEYWHDVRELHDPRVQPAGNLADAERMEPDDPDYPSFTFGSVTDWSLPNIAARSKQEVEKRVLAIDNKALLRK